MKKVIFLLGFMLVSILTFGQWKVQYFDNNKLEGDPVYTGSCDSINFDWSKGTGIKGLGLKYYSARFTNIGYFDGGEYEYTTSHDDGLRFYVDGNIVYDSWMPQSAKERTGSVAISKGLHTITVEYFQINGLAICKFNLISTNKNDSNVSVEDNKVIGEYILELMSDSTFRIRKQ